MVNLENLRNSSERLVGRIESILSRPAFNYLIHTAPFDMSARKHYHWHLEFSPRLVKPAGFEWGAGDYINMVSPEDAARVLRSMTAPIRFCLVLHNHQPIGNFDSVYEQAYQDSYLPFLDVFEHYADLQISLHTSGPLMEWLDEHHPDYLDRLAALVVGGPDGDHRRGVL